MNNFLHNVVKSLAVALFVSSQAMAFYVNTSVIAAYTVGRVISQTVNEGGFTYHYDTRDNLPRALRRHGKFRHLPVILKEHRIDLHNFLLALRGQFR